MTSVYNKSLPEITLLETAAKEALDTNHASGVEREEFDGNNANTTAIAKTLDEFGIVTYDDYQYWTQQYKPGTDVRKNIFGDFETASGEPQSLRQQCQSAYDSGQLADMAISIENDPRQDQALTELTHLEDQWDAFVRQQTPFSRKATLSELTTATSENQSDWERAGIDPKTYFSQMSDAELKTLRTCLLVKKFFFGTDNKMDLVSGKPFKGSSLLEGATLTEVLIAHSYDCNSISTLTLHLMQRQNTSLQVQRLADHATLYFESANGNALFFNNAREFLPPDQFDLPGNKNPYSNSQRGYETPKEPWMILGSIMKDQSITLGTEDSATHLAEKRALIEEALELDPDSYSSNLTYSIVLQEAEDWPTALTYALKALEINPFEQDGYTLTAISYFKMATLLPAREYLILDNPEKIALQEQSILYARKALEHSPDKPKEKEEATLLLIRCLYNHHDFVEAQALCEAIIHAEGQRGHYYNEKIHEEYQQILEHTI